MNTCLKTYLSGVLLIVLLAVGSVNGQDIHFSQYFASPLNLNPSLTGNFDGDFRFVGNFRNQWSSITTPYRTLGFSADARNLFKSKNLHTGLSVISDEAGDGDFGTVLVNISVAYAYPLTPDSSHIITFGIQPGYAQNRLNTADLTFDNQYSVQLGRFDPTAASSENIGTTSQSYFNLGAGLNWDYRIYKSNKISTGASLFNILRPRQSFFGSNDVRINRRMTVHTNAQVRIFPQIDLLPGISLMRQGKYNEFIFGTSARYLINGLTNLHLGYWYRNKDAGFVTGGITHQSFYFGVSYDINTSQLQEASRNRGGVEFSIIYTFKKFKGTLVKYKACPNYL